MSKPIKYFIKNINEFKFYNNFFNKAPAKFLKNL